MTEAIDEGRLGQIERLAAALKEGRESGAGITVAQVEDGLRCAREDAPRLVAEIRRLRQVIAQKEEAEEDRRYST